MRIDPATVAPGKRVKVRCPHCNGIGFIEHEPSAGEEDRAPKVADKSTGARQASSVEPADTTEEDASQPWEPSLPSDAFGDFRFPAEARLQPSAGIARPFRSRAILWVGLSLGIIFFFAALVNLVVQGPAK